MIQTVGMAQVLVARAALVDLPRLTAAQHACDLIAAETCLQDAFATDVRPVVREWRQSKGLPQNPLDASRQSGYVERISRERAGRNMPSADAYA
jgi:L-rhamnose isomerase/sugar isomerase